MSRWGRCRGGEVSSRAGKALRASAVVVGALAFVLSLSLAATGCGDATSGPEAAVQKYLTAIEDQDVDTVIELTTPPEEIATLEEMGMSKEDLKHGLEAEKVRMLGSLEFSDITMETEQKGDEAVVLITGGSVTMEGMGVAMDLAAVQDLGFPTKFYLYELDGNWYINTE